MWLSQVASNQCARGRSRGGGVEETCCSSRSDFWLRERLKTKKELVVV